MDTLFTSQGVIDTLGDQKAKTDGPIVSSWKKMIVVFLIKLELAWFALIHLKNPWLTWKVLNHILYLVKQYFGGHDIPKISKVGNKYYWDMYGPSWPSVTFRKHVQDEFNRYGNPRHTTMRTVLLSITSKCPMQCDHCYEWDNLNVPEKLSLESLKKAIEELQQNRTCQIYLGGGEPMMRFADICELLKFAKPGTEFWLATSGYNITPERAKSLKNCGLTGVSISLDHYLPDEHNAFRHHNQSYYWAQLAAHSAREAGLVVAMSLCSSKNFTSEKNLIGYANVAHRWGASFIQILEPRAVGHYGGKDVTLNTTQKECISNFANALNSEKKYKKFPAVIYHEPFFKSVGCSGAGDRSVYVDPLGNVHACPFCRKATGNITDGLLANNILALRKNGCPTYKPIT